MLVYRPHRPDEVDDAIKLISDVYREVLGREVNKFVRDEVHRILDDFEEDNDLFLVAEHGDEMVGTVFIEHNNPEADCCNMQFLVVRRDHRGHGHGRELVSRGLEFAREAGFKTVELNATADFDFAITMYESMGFELIDTYLWQGSEVLTFDKFL
jgi:N-acetylglutamate synthase-like GNAT family acetyltransferase